MLVRIALGPKDTNYQGNQIRGHEGDTGPAQEVVTPRAVTLRKADHREESSDHQRGDQDAVEHPCDAVGVRVGFGEINPCRERGREEPESVGGGRERRRVPKTPAPDPRRGEEGLCGEEGRQAQHEELNDCQALGDNESRGMRTIEDVRKPEGMLDRRRAKAPPKASATDPNSRLRSSMGRTLY